MGKNLINIILSAAILLISSSQQCCAVAQHETLPTYNMKATFYADRFQGRKTSSGELFDQNKLTAAHKSIKLGTWVRVTNKRNEQHVIVKINDRCPKQGVIDLSRSAATSIGIKGVSDVTVEILPDDNYSITPANDSKSSRADSGKADGKQEKKNKESKTNSQDKTLYNIELGTYKNLREAHTASETLPIPYQDNIVYSQNIKNSNVVLILELRQSENEAKATLKRLASLFPDSKIVAYTRR